MSTRIQRILSVAIGADTSSAVKELGRFHRAMAEVKQYTMPYAASMRLVKAAIDEYQLSATQAEAVTARLAAQHEKRTAKIREETEALRARNREEMLDAQGRSARHASRRAFATALDEVLPPVAAKPVGNQSAITTAAKADASLARQAYDSLKASMLGVVGPAYVLYRALDAVRSAIRLSADVEAARAKFKVFTGSAEEANRTLTELRLLSAKGISFTGGQQAVTTMLQFGVSAKNVVKDFKAIAEITGGDTARMNRLALAFAQTSTAGRLVAQDLNQMVQAGFNPLKVISEQTGVSLLKLKERMREGAISSEMVRQAFLDATSEGGKFNGLLEEIANTTAGKLTRAQSEIEEFAIAFGDMLKPATDGVLDAFIDDMDRLSQSARMLSGSDVKLSWLTTLLTTKPEVEALKTPSYLSDIVDAKFVPDAGTSPLAQQIKQKAEATVRLDNSRLGILVSPADRKAAEEYLADLAKLEAILEQIREGKRVSATEAELAAAKELDAIRQREALNRHIDDQTYNRMRQETDAAIKRSATKEDAQKLELEFIEKVKTLDPSRLGKAELDWAEATRKALHERNAEMARAELAQETFANAIGKARKSAIEAQYGDNAESVSLLISQSVDTEREKLEALVAQGAAYSAIVAAANAEAQAQAKSLDAARAKAKAAEEAAKTLDRAETLKEIANKSNVESNKRDWAGKTFGMKDGTVLGQIYDASGTAEKIRINDMVIAGKTYAEIIASMDQATQDQAKRLEKAHDWDKKTKNAERYKRELEELKTKAKELADSQKPNSEFIEKMAQLNLMRDKGGLDPAVYAAERNRLLNENVKNVESAAAPVFARGSQEAYQFITGQTVDKVTKQLQEAEKLNLIQSATKDILTRTNEKLDELISGKPQVMGP